LCCDIVNIIIYEKRTELNVLQGLKNSFKYIFAQGANFAQEFFSLWPTDVDMVFSPMETGQTVEYTPEQVISDISWTDALYSFSSRTFPLPDARRRCLGCSHAGENTDVQ
jgi:hypothetical protein